MRDSSIRQNTTFCISRGVGRAPGNFGVFPLGDALIDFLSTGPAGAACFRILMGFMRENFPSQRQARIETYAHSDGITYRVMRYACNPPTAAPIIPVVPGESDPVAEENAIWEVIDTLAFHSVSGGVDPPITSMIQTRQTLAPANPEAAPRGKGVFRKYFDSIIMGSYG